MVQRESEGSARFVDQAGVAGGVLFVVATPIGNMDDITLRALQVLRDADGVLAEDTRRTARLLRRHGIATPMSPLHEHNERAQVPGIVARVASGARLALVSDAGTPLLSDPGFNLVRALREAGAVVVPVPGPSAVTCALSVAGLPADRFCFEGFLPPRTAARGERLAALARESRTMVFFEAPHRLVDCVTQMCEAFGPAREAAIARELTKIHEEVRRGSLADLASQVAEAPNAARGEIVVLVAGIRERAGEPGDSADVVRCLETLLPALPFRQAVALTARIVGARRNDVYRQALALRDDGEP